MDALHAFCTRLLGDSDAARETERSARERGGDDPVAALAAAATACRQIEEHGAEDAVAGPDPETLAGAVARELAAATARLPERQREALALRELLGLDHDRIARVLGVDRSAVAPLLARARLRLRTELRGEGAPPPPCDERERALRTITLRQDGEPVSDADDDWLIEHLGHCVGCARGHAAMLEASVCYRAWRPDADTPAPAAAGS
jgi:RNA polymerase sigma factor (sigma-70 family)